METGSSNSPRRQLSSQGWVQIRAAYAGQHVLFANQPQGLFVFALRGQGHIPLGIDAERAAGLAERLPSFVDDRAAGQTFPGMKGDGLGGVAAGHRTDLDTFAAEHASALVDVGLLFCHPDTETLGRMLDGRDPGGQQSTDAAVAQNPDQARTVGKVEGQAGLHAILFVCQLDIEVRV